MKILVITENFLVGGLETRLDAMKKAWICQGHEVSIYASNIGETELAKENKISKIPDKYLTDPFSHESKKFMDKIIKKERPDFVDIHPFTSINFGGALALYFNVPFSITIHGLPSFEFLTNNSFPFFIATQASLLIGVSQKLVDLLKTYYPNQKIELVLNGVNFDNTKLIPKMRDSLLLVSRLDQYKLPAVKNVLNLVTNSAYLKKIIRKVDVVGAGDSLEDLKRCFSKSELNINFLGEIDNASFLMEKYEYVAGVGRVALEGIASNCTVLLVDNYGVAGLVNRDNFKHFAINNFFKVDKYIHLKEVEQQFKDKEKNAVFYNCFDLAKELNDVNFTSSNFIKFALSAMKNAATQKKDVSSSLISYTTWQGQLNNSNINIKSKTAVIEKLRKKLARLEISLDKSRSELTIKDSKISDLNNKLFERDEHIRKIYNGKLWRLLKIYFDARDKLIEKVSGTFISESRKSDISTVKSLLNNSIFSPIGVEKSKSIYIFAGVPFYDVGAGQRSSQLAKTFNKLGYLVHYYYAYDSSDNSDQLYSELPLAAHNNIQNLNINNIDAKNALFIFEIPHRDFITFLRFGKKNKITTIYEIIDNWNTNLGVDFFDEKIHEEFILSADFVTATAKNLANEFSVRYKREICYLANAVDIDLFDKNKNYVKPMDLIIGKKTFLYHGSLWGSWFDWNLVTQLANSQDDIQINLIGDDSNLQEIKNKLPKNIVFLGLKKQTELPAYLSHVDYAILPFKVDEIGKYVSPLKIFEYIAMGKKILSTELPDISGYPNVYCSNDVSDWIKKTKNKFEFDSNVDNFLVNNSWYERCGKIVTLANFRILDVTSPKLSIIILNYNNLNKIQKCLKFLNKFNKNYGYEVIVIDNGSTDGSFEVLMNNSNIALYKNTINGCASGRNLGIQKSSGEYLVFLDSDQYPIYEYWLDSAINILLNYPEIGAASWAFGFITNYDVLGGPTHDNYELNILPSKLLARTNIDYMGSGGLVISRKISDLIGGFDDQFDPTSFEDTDISFKIKEIGKKISAIRSMPLIHEAHSTTDIVSDKYMVIHIKNASKMKKKWKRYLQSNNTNILKEVKKFAKRIKLYLKAYLYPVQYRSLNFYANKILEKDIRIITFPTVDWNTPLYQRPQHLALNFVKFNLSYVYGSGNYGLKEVDGIYEISENLYLSNKWDVLAKMIPDSWILLLSTQQHTTIDALKFYLTNGNKLIYDYVDEIHQDISGSRELDEFLKERHEFICNSGVADLVLCVSKKLYNEMIHYYPSEKVILVPNGVEFNHFQIKKDEKSIPADLIGIVSGKKPVIGYYGAMANWLDYDLINKTAKSNPEWEFVFIGIDYNNSLKKLDTTLSNVTFLGHKHYDDLPKYGMWFDIGIIPFAKGEIAKSTSPLKMYEYMAMGKPIVATEDLTECKGFDGVFIAKNNLSAFEKCIQEALSSASKKDVINMLHSQAMKNTWYERVKLIVQAMKKTQEN